MRCWPMTVAGPGLVKTSTTAKCGKYNSPTRYRAICAQHDLALMMRNFSNMFLRARRALEFSHSLGQKRSKRDVRVESALPQTADIGRRGRQVCSVPKPVVSRCSKTECAILRLRFYEA